MILQTGMRSKRNPTRFSYSTGASRIFSGSTEKYGIIGKPIFPEDFRRFSPIYECIFAHSQSFFEDVLMQRDSHLVLEKVGYMIFADKKQLREGYFTVTKNGI